MRGTSTRSPAMTRPCPSRSTATGEGSGMKIRYVVAIAISLLGTRVALAEWSGTQAGKPQGSSPGDPLAGYVLTDGGSTMTGPLPVNANPDVVAVPGTDLQARAADGGIDLITNGVTRLRVRYDGTIALIGNASIVVVNGNGSILTPDG